VESAERTDQLPNITLVGYHSDRRVDVFSPPVTTHSDQLIRFLRYKVVDVDKRFELSSYPVLTDDFSPVEYLTARVLRRAFDEPVEVDGEEMRAVADQLRRYGPIAPGTPGHMKIRDFLTAEMGGIAQEVTPAPTSITASFFMSETRREVLAARYDDVEAVAMLVELARSLIYAPVPPSVGVDMVFFDEDATAPTPAKVVGDVCPGAASGRCSSERLGATALDLLVSLRNGQ
jgi:hypothetical protein